MRRTLIALATATVAALTLAACGGGGGGGPLDSGPSAGAPSPSDTIKIGSANFSESQVLAAVYAQALQAKGVKVEQTPPLGSREAYIPAIKDGSIDLIPEYTGVLLQYLTRRPPELVGGGVRGAAKDATGAADRAGEVLGGGQGRVVVPKAVAQRYNASSLEDIARTAVSSRSGARRSSRSARTASPVSRRSTTAASSPTSPSTPVAR